MPAYVPKVSYGDGPTELLFTVPQGPPTPEAGETGGSEVSGAGVVAAFLINPMPTLEVRLRYTEAEWPALQAWIDFAKTGAAFDWYPDQTISVNHTCYLESPKMGERLRGSRSEVNGHFEVTLVLRRTTPAPFGARYYT